MQIYERIKLIRKHFKLSQTDFGEKLGVSRNVINNIELNRLVKPEDKEPVYKLICKEFNISEEWLNNGTGEMFIDEDTITLSQYFESRKATPLQQELVKGFLNLDSETRDEIMNLFKRVFSKEEYAAELVPIIPEVKTQEEPKTTLRVAARGNSNIEVEVTAQQIKEFEEQMEKDLPKIREFMDNSDL